ncbi:MAG: hypothetical protein IH898_06060 [Planctomycetes bacterium]|nr:hypothetical protein [Planctomycetota bacterium]
MSNRSVLYSRLTCLLLVLLAAGMICPVAGVAAETAALEKRTEAEHEETPLGEKWVRLSLDRRQKPLALEVAIVRYVRPELAHQPAARVQEYVDLIGAVHIGDRKYYRELNRRFRTYDALLYELVAPEGTVVQRGRGTSNTHPLGAMQNGMKTMLDIEHQLEQVDYTRANFVHADLSPDEFLKSMEDRGEGFVQLYFRMIGQALAQQSQQSVQGESVDLDILGALFSDDRPRRLKIVMAKQFESMESLLVGFSGPEGSTLITVRNKRALEVLRLQQAAGKRKLGIFYGAGHLSDMHERLVEEFGLTPIGIVWLEAWDLRAK